MAFSQLLAKRPQNPASPDPFETLVGHTSNTLETGAALLEGWGRQYLSTLGLSPDDEPLLRRAVLTADALHDMGKAAEPFQQLLRGRFRGPMPLSHEVISLLIILQEQELDQWLFPEGDSLLRKAVLWAVAGHHLRFKGDAIQARSAGMIRLTVHTGHPDFQALLKVVQSHLDLPSPPSLQDLQIDLLSAPETLLQPWVRKQRRTASGLSETEQRLVALIKGLLIATDLVGSAVPRRGLRPAEWATGAQSRVLELGDLAPLIERGLKGNPPRPFQEAVRDSPGRVTLVNAGCGTGKTTAAYLWAARQARGRKLFFSYPTTGTATQGFADYVLPVEDLDSALVHSRAPADIVHLKSNGVAENPSSPDDRAQVEEQLRYEALATWDVPLVVCTVDTVVGLVHNQRRALFSLPSLLQGAFIFDEIHLYDDRLFGGLLRFLQALPGVPVLLMTASLQPWRRALLEAQLQARGEALAVVEGPPELERLPRYTLRQVSPEAVLDQVRDALKGRQKVLWVVNSVARAMALAQCLDDEGLPVLLYHSRYEYRDRLRHHQALVDAFARERTGPVLAITTQVAEVSLDISADLLVTEIAPPTALIQRLGRLNRYAHPAADGGHTTQPCLVVPVERPDPYAVTELEQATRWLELVGEERPVSQWDLARALAQVEGGGTPEPVRAEWLDGGVLSTPTAPRTAGRTVSIIRQEVAREAAGSRLAAIERTIPMLLGPVAREIEAWPRVGLARIAPAGRVNYDERWGAEWSGT